MVYKKIYFLLHSFRNTLNFCYFNRILRALLELIKYIRSSCIQFFKKNGIKKMTFTWIRTQASVVETKKLTTGPKSDNLIFVNYKIYK